MVDFYDLISRKRIRYELGESTMPEKYRDFCLRVIDDEGLTPAVDLLSPKEDLINWLTSCWEGIVEESIAFDLTTMIVDEKKDMRDVDDRAETVEFICERLKERIFNVLESYDEYAGT